MDPTPDSIWFRRQNKWTEEQRLFLCCMVRFFERDNHAFSKVFSSAFEIELRQSGYTAGIAWAILHTQWNTMRRSGDPLWGAVHLSPFRKDGYGSWYLIIQKIKQIAQTLRIHLIEKNEDDIDISSYDPQPPKDQEHDEIAAAEDTRPGPELQAEKEHRHQAIPREPETDRNHQEVPTLVTAGGKICLFCFREGNTHEDLQAPADAIPPLLYRWSNVDSQGVNSKRLFMAGLFSEGTEYFHPSEIPQDEFNTFVENHLRIRKSLSPFISTFKTMLAPINRALRNEEGAIVSIIDRKRLTTPIYYARNMVRSLNLRFSWYNGVAEYLIWGNIPKSAIICSFKATTLLKLARENPEFKDLLQFNNIASFARSSKALHRVLGSGPGRLNHETGVTIGKFLFKLEVPYEHCQTVSRGMYYSWRMKREGGCFEEFYRGIEDGYYALDHLTPPPAMTAADENEDISDEVSEMSEASELADILPDISESLGNLELPGSLGPLGTPGHTVSPQISQMSQVSQASMISNISNTFETLECPGDFEAVDNPSADYQSNDETVASIDLFSMSGSPCPSPVIKLFDGATRQWIAQQSDIASAEPDSSAQTAISIDDSDDSDDEFDKVFSGCKTESSVFGSSPPALNELRLIPEEPVAVVGLKTEKNDTLTSPLNGSCAPTTPTPRDCFAADRERVLHFWG